MDEKKIERLAEILDGSKRAVFFGGAGVSTESGIPDFRSPGGIFDSRFAGLSPEEIISHDYFMAHTENFYVFYRERMLFPDAKPNAAHRFLAKLERAGKLAAVVTQNIDGLHEAAGSRTVYALHGDIHSNRCMHCDKLYGLDYILGSKGVPRCECGGIIKPEVVLYGESLNGDIVARAATAIGEADTLIVGGTSLAVYPAASYLNFFEGDSLVVINRTPTSADKRACLTITDNIGEVFAALDSLPLFRTL